MPPETVAVIHYPKRKNGFKKGWIAMGQEALDAWADPDLGGETYRVLMRVCGRLDFENYVLLNQSDLSMQMKMRQPNFARALKKLVNLEILLKGDRIGRTYSYRLNPHYGWKGSASNHQRVLKETGKMLHFPQSGNLP